MLLGNCHRRASGSGARQRLVLWEGLLVAGPFAQRLVEPFRLEGQHHEMHERIAVDDDEQDRREKEEGEQRQFDAEERQLDRLLEKEIGMRHRARGDREIEENEQIGEPQAPADRSRVVDRLLDRLEIVGLLDLRKLVGRSGRRPGRVWLGRLGAARFSAAGAARRGPSPDAPPAERPGSGLWRRDRSTTEAPDG